jgi:SAM-dependent methyltransferase
LLSYRSLWWEFAVVNEDSNMSDTATDLTMPSAEPNGFIKTLNNMGYMTSTLDPFSSEFARFAGVAGGPVLDVGAAYGVATLAALAAGARVLANDVDPRHLDILAKRAPDPDRARLDLVPGEFPQGLHLGSNSLAGVLICRVLHFFSGPRIEESARAVFDWLKPGGKVFVVAETPYLRNFISFITTYERRKKSGERWPGLVTDVKSIAPDRGASLPDLMHFLDPDVLRRVFSEVGFIIERAETFARPEFPADIQYDGRESVGLIAWKPGL